MTTAPLPTRLPAPAATWRRDVDIVVLGTGAAGLATALAARPDRRVLLVTKERLTSGSTAWAQGGLAAVLDPADSADRHVDDTLAAGAGLCDPDAVRALVHEAPGAVRELIRLGALFDPDADGQIALTMEGGHSHRRIVHAGGDRSGAEVQRTLDAAALSAGVELLEHTFVLDIVVAVDTSGARRAAGVRVARIDDRGHVESVGVVSARAVVLATGGYGQVFAATSNPPVVTGDGLAAALRAGVAARDVEFVQFHPTVLWAGPGAAGQQPLVSEAVRGEGAVLYDGSGRRVMDGVHPLGDLAPRDVVADAISRRLAEAPGGIGDHVWLDATHLGTDFYARFPTITEACRRLGIDPARDRIPVAPAAHYACGGVAADLDGVTELPGLFAVGEVACTGVHGANRLASNSLTEGVVAGTRLGRRLAAQLPPAVDVPPEELDERHGPAANPAHRLQLRSAMSTHVGVLRSADGLASASRQLADLAAPRPLEVVASQPVWETVNLLTVASAVVLAAAERTESRGCHRRRDHPHPRDAWRRHLDVRMSPSGHLTIHPGAPIA